MPFRATPPPNGPGVCDRCRKPVLWTTTTANRVSMAVNRAIDPSGNTAVRTDVDGHLWSRQLSNARPTAEINEVLHIPHVATCQAPRPHTHRSRPRPALRRAMQPQRWPR